MSRHKSVKSEDIETSDPTEAERLRTDDTPTPVNVPAKQANEGQGKELAEGDYYDPAESAEEGHARVHAEQEVPESQPANHGSPY